MGSSESRCCTETPQKTNKYEKKSGADFSLASDSLMQQTRVLQDDPRSPSFDVDRTPIEVPVTSANKGCLRNRHAVSNSQNNQITDIAPQAADCRTPLSTKHCSKAPEKFSYTSLVNPNHPAILDPRSPSQGIVRTPLFQQDAFNEENIPENKSSTLICDTPKKLEGLHNVGYTSDSEADPRSPTQELVRTPVAKMDKPEYQTDVVTSRNLHDPRSPTTDVSRTPLGALFSGHRELRRTVLMTNALMAKPLHKKVTVVEKPSSQVDTTSKPEENVNTDQEASEIDDEIPAILCCDFDLLNDSCSSSMVASIGSEVDCISFDESSEASLTGDDLDDDNIVESLLQNMININVEPDNHCLVNDHEFVSASTSVVSEKYECCNHGAGEPNTRSVNEEQASEEIPLLNQDSEKSCSIAMEAAMIVKQHDNTSNSIVDKPQVENKDGDSLQSTKTNTQAINEVSRSMLNEDKNVSTTNGPTTEADGSTYEQVNNVPNYAEPTMEPVVSDLVSMAIKEGDHDSKAAKNATIDFQFAHNEYSSTSETLDKKMSDCIKGIDVNDDESSSNKVYEKPASVTIGSENLVDNMKDTDCNESGISKTQPLESEIPLCNVEENQTEKLLCLLPEMVESKPQVSQVTSVNEHKVNSKNLTIDSESVTGAEEESVSTIGKVSIDMEVTDSITDHKEDNITFDNLEMAEQNEKPIEIQNDSEQKSSDSNRFATKQKITAECCLSHTSTSEVSEKSKEKENASEDKTVIKEKKPRKLRQPSKITSSRRSARAESEDTPSHITLSFSTKMRQLKARSLSTDESTRQTALIYNASGRENNQRILRQMSNSSQKTESKLYTQSQVRSPLAVLTNEMNSMKTEGKSQFGYSPAKMHTTTSNSRLPRYQGTPPIQGNRSLSVSFSGRSSAKKLHSPDRSRSNQRSFSYGKEN
ncbi:uncharacterized protein LOC120336234 isoform X1 [Styela clava]